uniref:Homeobox domain-containing protein n=1 Tax=Daphnia galeata TaxID=27404 RepID=A0A8J2WK83_9CRUS|nr:unnamed protein product [Daphnia galeata]
MCVCYFTKLRGASVFHRPPNEIKVPKYSALKMDTYKCARDGHHHHRRQDANNLPDYVQTVVVKDSKGLEKILLLPKALDLDRPKRSRTAFAKWQLDALETTFCSHPYLIKVWYQNRRTKQRKEGHPAGGSDEQTTSNRIENLNAESSGSPPETKWPPQQQQQQHQTMSAEFFGQAFQHHYHHPAAMYHQLIQSYSSHHHAAMTSSAAAGLLANNNAAGIVTTANSPAVSVSSAGVMSTADRGHHQIHRVY